MSMEYFKKESKKIDKNMKKQESKNVPEK